jgi:hypothetical protein
MKKLTLSIMTASVLLLFSATQLKAGTESNSVSTSVTTTVNADDSNADAVRMNEIKALEMPALSSSANKELLKEGSSVKNDQGRHGRGYERRNRNRDVDVSIRADNPGYHSHSGAYIGGGGVLLLIIILILFL